MVIENKNSQSVCCWLSLLQQNIGRHASQSATCKICCVTIVAGILAFSAQSQNLVVMLSSFLAILACFIMDAFYLVKERTLVKFYNDAVNKLESNELDEREIFSFPPSRKDATGRSSITCKDICAVWGSISIRYFYSAIVAIVVIAIFMTYGGGLK